MRTSNLAAISAVALIGCTHDNGTPPPSPCVEKPGTACVWAGQSGRTAFNGDGLDRRATLLYQPIDITFAADGTPWFIDWNNFRIRKVLPDQTVTTVVGSSFPGDPIDNPDTLKAPGAPGDEVQLNHPTDLVFRSDGKLVFAAWHNFKVAELDPATTDVMILYGRGQGFAGDGGAATDVRFNFPKAVAYDSKGNLYVLDQRNLRVRRIAPDGSVIETFAGNGQKGFQGDGGPAKDCELTFEVGTSPEPSGALAIDKDDNVYIADVVNNRIRKVDTNGIITTVAGDGTKGFKGDGDFADRAEFNNVKDMAFGPDGRLYVADADNQRIRAIDLFGSGRVETVAGSGVQGGGDPDGKPALEIELDRPWGIAFDKQGALYIADTFNSRIVKIPR